VSVWVITLPALAVEVFHTFIQGLNFYKIKTKISWSTLRLIYTFSDYFVFVNWEKWIANCGKNGHLKELNFVKWINRIIW